jgi:hypothetical protein
LSAQSKNTTAPDDDRIADVLALREEADTTVRELRGDDGCDDRAVFAEAQIEIPAGIGGQLAVQIGRGLGRNGHTVADGGLRGVCVDELFPAEVVTVVPPAGVVDGDVPADELLRARLAGRHDTKTAIEASGPDRLQLDLERVGISTLRGIEPRFVQGRIRRTNLLTTRGGAHRRIRLVVVTSHDEDRRCQDGQERRPPHQVSFHPFHVVVQPTLFKTRAPLREFPGR